MNKLYYIILGFIFFLFVVLYVMLCYYSRLSSDDYYFIWDARKNGIIGSVYLQYMRWCGRYSSNIIMSCFNKWFGVTQIYYCFIPFVTYCTLIAGMYLFINSCTHHYKIIMAKKDKWFATFSFTALLYFSSYDYGETWFWCRSICSHLWSVVAIILGTGFLFYSKNKLISHLGIFVCFVFLGGASEVFTVIYGIFLTLFIIFEFRKSESYKSFISSSFNKKLSFLYVIIAFAFIIRILSPGDYLRDELFPERTILNTFFITAKSIIKFFVIYLPYKIPAVIAFSVPFVLIGKYVNEKNPNIFTINFSSYFKRITLLFIATLLFCFLLIAYVMVETGPPRVVFLISFIVTIYCCMVSFYLGYSNYVDDKKIIILKTASIILGLVLVSSTLFSQYKSASKYSFAVDKRIAYLVETNNVIKKDTLIKLIPLPPSGMLYSCEISKDTNFFTNKEIRLGYNLNFHVIKE